MPDDDNAAVIDLQYDISDYDIGREDIDLGVRLNCKRFTINISPRNFRNSPLAEKNFNKYRNLLRAGKEHVDGVCEYLEDTVSIFLPQFTALAPPVTHSGPLTLADLSARGSFICQLNIIDEKLHPTTVTPVVHEEYEEDFDIRTLNSPFFPIFRPSDVEIPYKDVATVFDILPREVLVHGHPLFYKTSYSIEGSKAEISKYAKIATSGLSPTELRVPRLYGIVVGNSQGRILGLLYHRIKTAAAAAEQSTLTWAVDEATPMAVREKWARQIRDTVEKMHELGVVWGDVKAENVLIDGEGDAVVIDLEGGTTRDWVDKEKGGTVEGDLQGLERIMDYIFNDDSVLRPPLEPNEDEEFEEGEEEEWSEGDD